MIAFLRMRGNRLIAFVIFIFVCLSVSAQNVMTGTYPNGENMKSGDVFLLDDQCSFIVRDEAGDKVRLISSTWTLVCLDEKTEYIVERVVENVNEFNFLLNGLSIDSQLLKIVEFSGDNSRYFQAKIICKGLTESSSEIDLEIPIYLNLLPSVPKIEVLNIKYDLEKDYSSINLKMEADRADSYAVVHRYYMNNRPPGNSYWDNVTKEEANTYFSWANCPDIIEFRVLSLNRVCLYSPTFSLFLNKEQSTFLPF